MHQRRNDKFPDNTKKIYRQSRNQRNRLMIKPDETIKESQSKEQTDLIKKEEMKTLNR